ncbi:ABC transporter substrate-binding protein [Terrarubrum flagellatum]|uniref:ABC transporter substrate-binding protein n=1 Tax=Terrirubrum flagellatum TaxID=2895980 RepID=UPI00314547AF
MRIMTIAAALLASAALTGSAFAQAKPPIKLADVAELSGQAATAANNWKNGIDMAVAEINAAGGVLGGHMIEVSHADSQSNPGLARALVQKALDSEPYALLGPTSSGSVKVTAALAQQAGVTQVMAGEASELTRMGDPHLFRTSFGQQSSMPKLALWVAKELQAKSVAVVWVNNDFGKGGRDEFKKAAEKLDVKVVADLSTEAGQVDFAADVLKVKNAKPDAVFVYTNEDESARFLREAQKQNLGVPMIGETTLLGQKVIDLAAGAAEGVKGHVGLTADADVDLIKDFKKKFTAKYNYAPDHNCIKGYIAIYAIKVATEKMGKLDPKNLSKAMHGLSINVKDVPQMLLNVSWDENGDIDRDSFLAEVKGGKQQIIKVLPKLNP